MTHNSQTQDNLDASPDYSFDPVPDLPYAYGFNVDDSDSSASSPTRIELMTQPDTINWVNTQRAHGKVENFDIVNPTRPERIIEFVHEMFMFHGIKECTDALATLIDQDKLSVDEAETAITAWHTMFKDSLDMVHTLLRNTLHERHSDENTETVNTAVDS